MSDAISVTVADGKMSVSLAPTDQAMTLAMDFVYGSASPYQYDSNGLCDIAIDGKSDTDCDANELDAIVSGFTKEKV